MSRISRVTTNNGDRGETRLATGKKVAKADPLIRALGSTDELNSAIGLLRCHLISGAQSARVQITLGEVQQALFDLGAVLALEGQYDAKTLVSGQDSIAQAIAAMNAKLPPLTEFVIPGGSIAAAHSHLCRTVCRRSETDLWAALDGYTELENEEAIDNLRNAGVYLNRLSDYFFVLARTLMIDSEEPQWRGPQKGA